MEKASEKLFNSFLKASLPYELYIPDIHPVQLPVRQEQVAPWSLWSFALSLYHKLWVFSAL